MPDDTESVNPSEIAILLLSPDPKEQALGYSLFLLRTHWVSGSTAEDLKNIACKQFSLPNSAVFAAEKQIEPAMMWASQDGLEADKLNMVEAAWLYCQKIKAPLPPPVIWHLYDNRKISYIVHDGHHRVYFAYRYKIRLKAIILEAIGAEEQLDQRLNYAFQIQKRVIDLPIIRGLG